MKTQSLLFFGAASTFITAVVASDPFSSDTIEKLRNKLKTDKYKNNVGEVYSNSNSLLLTHCPPWEEAEIRLAYVDGSYRSPSVKNQRPCDWDVNYATCIKDINSVQYAFHVMGRSPQYADFICATIFIETDRSKTHWLKEDTLSLGQPELIFHEKPEKQIEISPELVQKHPRWRSVSTSIKNEDVKLTPEKALKAAKEVFPQLFESTSTAGFKSLVIENLSLEVENAKVVYIFRSFQQDKQLIIKVGAKDGKVLPERSALEADERPLAWEEQQANPEQGSSKPKVELKKEEIENKPMGSLIDSEYDTHRSPGLHLSGAKAIIPSQDREVFKSPSLHGDSA